MTALTKTMVTPDEKLAVVVGKKPMARTEVVKKLWAYIKKHELQDLQNKRTINSDETFKDLFNKDSFNMFEMQKMLSTHLK